MSESITCFNRTYNGSLYDGNYFFREADVTLGLLLILTGEFEFFHDVTLGLLLILTGEFASFHDVTLGLYFTVSSEIVS